MRFVLVLIGTMVGLDLLWWAASTRIAKPIFARIAVAIFALAQLTGLIWLLAQRFARAESTPPTRGDREPPWCRSRRGRRSEERRVGKECRAHWQPSL